MQNLTSSIIILSVTSLCLFVLPIICTLLWKRRAKAGWLPLFLGAAGFILFARVLELGVHMVCIVSDNPISRTILGSTPLFVLYGALMAGIFEECGRYVFLRFCMKKHRTREDLIMYGIGHGGIDVWTILTAFVSYLVIDVLLLTQGREGALSLLDPAGTGQVAAALEAAAGFSISQGVLNIVERLLAMSVHVSLTLAVGYGVIRGKSRVYLPLAILGHAIVDIFAALYQRGAVSLLLCEGWLLIWAALLAVWAVKLYKRLGES